MKSEHVTKSGTFEKCAPKRNEPSKKKLFWNFCWIQKTTFPYPNFSLYWFILSLSPTRPTSLHSHISEWAASLQRPFGPTLEDQTLDLEFGNLRDWGSLATSVSFSSSFKHYCRVLYIFSLTLKVAINVRWYVRNEECSPTKSFEFQDTEKHAWMPLRSLEQAHFFRLGLNFLKLGIHSV